MQQIPRADAEADPQIPQPDDDALIARLIAQGLYPVCIQRSIVTVERVEENLFIDEGTSHNLIGAMKITVHPDQELGGPTGPDATIYLSCGRYGLWSIIVERVGQVATVYGPQARPVGDGGRQGLAAGMRAGVLIDLFDKGFISADVARGEIDTLVQCGHLNPILGRTLRERLGGPGGG